MAELNQIKAGVAGQVGEAPEAPPAPEAPEAPGATAGGGTGPETTYSTNGSATQTEEYQPAEGNGGYQGGGYDLGNGGGFSSAGDAERIHEIAEAIVNERWKEFLERVGDIAAWKEKTDMTIISIKQEIIRTQEKFENLQNAVLGRIKESDMGLKDVHTELRALEKVFEKITEPLVMNIKELGKITEELKKKR